MRVDRLRAAYQIDVKFRHFPLHPDTSKKGLTLEQLFAGRNIDIPAAKTRMAGLMADEGLPYGDRTMTYNSRLAQEMAKWAETQLARIFHKFVACAVLRDGPSLGKSGGNHKSALHQDKDQSHDRV